MMSDDISLIFDHNFFLRVGGGGCRLFNEIILIRIKASLNAGFEENKYIFCNFMF